MCPPATTQEGDWFHQQTAKLLYLCKCVRPECLTTVAFLATRVTKVDQDDLGKLRRVIRYISHTRTRGIRLRPSLLGTTVRAYIDAAYGVHSDCKSHTGCPITYRLSNSHRGRRTSLRAIRETDNSDQVEHGSRACSNIGLGKSGLPRTQLHRCTRPQRPAGRTPAGQPILHGAPKQREINRDEDATHQEPLLLDNR